MSGNVNEWCWDWYGTYPSGAASDPRGDNDGTNRRVYRGGNYGSLITNPLRVSYRQCSNPKYNNLNLGFRLVRSKQ